MARSDRAGRYTVRSAGAVIPFWIGVVVLAVVAVTPIVNRDWRVAGFAVPVAVLLAWALWMILYRPAVHYDSSRAVVINIARVHVLPWGHVTRVRQGIGLIFDLDAGKPVTAIGAPAPRRSGNVMSNFDRRTRPPEESFNRDSDLLEGVRRAAPPDPAPVTAAWDTVPLVIGAVLVAAVVVVIAIGI